MDKQILKINSGKAIVLSSLNGNFSILDKLDNIATKYDYIILNGNLFCEKICDINFNNNILYCVGNNDLINLKNYYSFINKIFKFPTLIELKFLNSSFFVCCGAPNNKGFLYYPFVSFIDEKPWHETYNGNNGYIISNNPISCEEPKFYNYSCRIGHTNKIFAQEVDQYGLKNTFELL